VPAYQEGGIVSGRLQHLKGILVQGLRYEKTTGVIPKISDEDTGCLFRFPTQNFSIPDPQQRIQVRIFIFNPKNCY
jgi:hypothetical protein